MTAEASTKRRSRGKRPKRLCPERTVLGAKDRNGHAQRLAQRLCASVKEALWFSFWCTAGTDLWLPFSPAQSGPPAKKQREGGCPNRSKLYPRCHTRLGGPRRPPSIHRRRVLFPSGVCGPWRRPSPPNCRCRNHPCAAPAAAAAIVHHLCSCHHCCHRR